MKIRISRLRSLIREALEEADAQTIPAGASPGEQAFNGDMSGRKWGAPKNPNQLGNLKANNPAQQKAVQVMNILRTKGVYAKMSQEQRQNISGQVEQHVSKMSPEDLLMADANTLADEVTQKLGLAG
jgi:hypothetical protein